MNYHLISLFLFSWYQISNLVNEVADNVFGLNQKDFQSDYKGKTSINNIFQSKLFDTNKSKIHLVCVARTK